jgi:hypothetical protein
MLFITKAWQEVIVNGSYAIQKNGERWVLLVAGDGCTFSTLGRTEVPDGDVLGQFSAVQEAKDAAFTHWTKNPKCVFTRP